MKNKFEIFEDRVEIEATLDGCVKTFTISPEDFEKVSGIKNRWYLRKAKHLVYVYYQDYVNGKRTSIHLHQLIMGTFGNGYFIVVDHINGDPTDNRRSNLQVVPQKENVRKAKLFSTNTSGYRNVQWKESRQKYRVEVARNKQYKYVGYFDTIEEAVAARDAYLATIA